MLSTSLLFKKHIYVLLYDYIITLHNLQPYESSKIKLTGDSYVTSLEDEDDSYSNIDFNGYTLYVNGNPISK